MGKKLLVRYAHTGTGNRTTPEIGTGSSVAFFSPYGDCDGALATARRNHKSALRSAGRFMLWGISYRLGILGMEG